MATCSSEKAENRFGACPSLCQRQWEALAVQTTTSRTTNTKDLGKVTFGDLRMLDVFCSDLLGQSKATPWRKRASPAQTRAHSPEIVTV